jgi:hypothetical protein
MQPDTILAARDLGRIGAPPHDGGDDRAIAGGARGGGEGDPIADMEAGIGGQPLVDGNSSKAPLSRKPVGEEGDQREENEGVAGGQRRTVPTQLPVSASECRVSAIEYDGSA